MEKLVNRLLDKRKLVTIIFLIACVICAVCSFTVETNYNMADYLPDDAQSTIGIKVLEDEFGAAVPNARVMIPNVDIASAIEAKQKLSSIDGVIDVMWLDDIIDMSIPLEMQDKATIEGFYKDNSALFSVTVDKGKQVSAVSAIRELAGSDGAVTGSIVDTASAMDSSADEIKVIMLFAVPMVLIILLLSTSSWIEPILFLITIGAAILLNMGTNAFFGEISFVTSASAAVLQFAVSMDYSIFLLHRFSEFRSQGMEVKEAMCQAIKKSFSSIFASGLTTVIGFAALIFMRFKIGPDMGIVLAKGIVFSLLTVLLLLPALAMLCYKIIDKTHHRSFIPKFGGFGKVIAKLRIPALILIVVISVPAFLAQNKTQFLYGASEFFPAGSELGQDRIQIVDTFGEANQMVLMVPKGNFSSEKELGDQIQTLPNVVSVVSYAQAVGNEVPTEYLTPEQSEQFFSKNYSRIIVTASCGYESDEAFTLTEQIREAAVGYYGGEFYLAGESPSTYDIKTVITDDNAKVMLLAIIGIAIVLLFTFKNAIIPLVLLVSIESAIWINLSVPYFGDTKLFYIVYLIMSAIQLGATVDYAILFGTRYTENRARLDKKKAIVQTISDTSASILTSAIILAIAGFCLGYFSSNVAISQIGILLGRGALLSCGSVLLVLPALMYVFDFLIQKTTFKSKKKV